MLVLVVIDMLVGDVGMLAMLVCWYVDMKYCQLVDMLASWYVGQ